MDAATGCNEVTNERLTTLGLASYPVIVTVQPRPIPGLPTQEGGDAGLSGSRTILVVHLCCILIGGGRPDDRDSDGRRAHRRQWGPWSASDHHRRGGRDHHRRGGTNPGTGRLTGGAPGRHGLLQHGVRKRWHRHLHCPHRGGGRRSRGEHRGRCGGRHRQWDLRGTAGSHCARQTRKFDRSWRLSQRLRPVSRLRWGAGAEQGDGDNRHHGDDPHRAGQRQACKTTAATGHPGRVGNP